MANECKVTMGSPVLFYSQILIQLSYHKLLCISTERAIAPHVNSTLCVAICKKFEATSWGSSCPNHLLQLVILTNVMGQMYLNESWEYCAIYYQH